jgi:hypothetical protein
MDGHEFDDLVRHLGTARLTRVRMLRGLAAGALASVIGTKVGVDQVAQAQGGQCRGEGVNCEGGGQVCCPGTVCNGLENPTKCRVCGGPGQLCCAGGTCTATTDVCLPSGTCGPAVTTPCGQAGEACCPPNGACVSPLICQGDICQAGAACGAQGQACCAGGLCATGFTCSNGTCQPFSISGGGSGGSVSVFRCGSNAECAARSAAAPFCDTANGQCFGIRGLNCKSGESPQQCCNRSVKKGCNRKQQSHHAKKNCLKKGKKRCRNLLAGVV